MALGYLFSGQASPPCLDAADANGDGVADISDAITVLEFLFSGRGTIPFPGPKDDCAQDPTGDPVSCAAFSPCATSPEVFRATGGGAVQRVGWIFAEGGRLDVVGFANEGVYPRRVSSEPRPAAKSLK